MSLLALLVCFLSACSPYLRLPGNAVIDPKLTSTAIVMPDGASLPLYTWPHSGSPRAIVLALHGFNDYGEFVKDAAIYLGELRASKSIPTIKGGLGGRLTGVFGRERKLWAKTLQSPQGY